MTKCQAVAEVVVTHRIGGLESQTHKEIFTFRRYTPHRWLRNVSQITVPDLMCYTPHRWLRKLQIQMML